LECLRGAKAMAHLGPHGVGDVAHEDDDTRRTFDLWTRDVPRMDWRRSSPPLFVRAASHVSAFEDLVAPA
jgi:hypothetical protein